MKRRKKEEEVPVLEQGQESEEREGEQGSEAVENAMGQLVRSTAGQDPEEIGTSDKTTSTYRLLSSTDIHALKHCSNVSLLHRLKRVLEPSYLYANKRMRALQRVVRCEDTSGIPTPSFSSSSCSFSVCFSSLFSLSSRLSSTTRAPPDYRPTIVYLPIGDDVKGSLELAAGEDLASPVGLSALHPLYHPPFPLVEEIQNSQFFALGQINAKLDVTGNRAKRAAEEERRKIRKKNCVKPNSKEPSQILLMAEHKIDLHPPSSLFWDYACQYSLVGHTTLPGKDNGSISEHGCCNNAGDNLEGETLSFKGWSVAGGHISPSRQRVEAMSKASWIPDVFGLSENDEHNQMRKNRNDNAHSVQTYIHPKVYIQPEWPHGRKKMRIFWNTDNSNVTAATTSSGSTTTNSSSSSSRKMASPPNSITDIPFQPLRLGPPHIELIPILPENGRSSFEIAMSVNCSGAFILYSIRDPAHLECCRARGARWEEGKGRLSFLSESFGWFLYDDKNRPIANLKNRRRRRKGGGVLHPPDTHVSIACYAYKPGNEWVDSVYARKVLVVESEEMEEVEAKEKRGRKVPDIMEVEEPSIGIDEEMIPQNILTSTTPCREEKETGRERDTSEKKKIEEQRKSEALPRPPATEEDKKRKQTAAGPSKWSYSIFMKSQKQGDQYSSSSSSEEEEEEEEDDEGEEKGTYTSR